MSKETFSMRKIGKHLVNVSMLGLAVAPIAGSVLAPVTVLAAEYKSGQDGSNQLNFTAVSKKNTTETKVSQHKPMDLVAILDYSSSFQGKRNTALTQLKTLIQTDLTDEDHVMLQAYIYNKPASYAAHGAQLDYSKLKDADWETGVSTVLLSKSEAIAMIDKLLQIKYPNTPGGLPTYSDLFNAVSKTFGDKAFKNGDKDGDKVTIVPFEDVYTSQTNKNKMVSVVQFTDGWADTEKMDGTFAAWAKSNAKTFMSVVNRNKVTNEDNNDPNSIKSMTELGHPNIYDVTGKDEATVMKEMLEQFKNTATEKVVAQTTTTKQKGHITITPEAGVTLKTAELVDPSGKKTPLTIKDNKVSVDTGDLNDGKYVVNYTFGGSVDSAKKITSSVTVDGKEVDKKEDTILPVAKPTVRAEKIPFQTETKEDPTLPAGEKKVVQKGVEGEKEITTLEGKSTEKVVKQPVNEIIHIGTKGAKSEVTEKKVPFETIKKDDPTLEEGQEKVVQEGVEGVIKVTTTYETQKGEKVKGSEKVTEVETVKKVDKIIAVGTKGSKSEVTEKKVPFETIYKQDPTLKKGEEKVLQEGVEGVIKVTTTYETQKGQKVDGSEKVTEETVTEKVDKIVAQGTMEKRKVRYRVVDSKGQELVKQTDVMEAYQDEEYKVETPKLDGYRLELAKDSVPATGKVADRDVLVTFVAVKIGKPVTLKFVDESGSEIAQKKVLTGENAEVDTEFNGEAPETIEKDGVKYAFVGIKQTGSKERKVSGKVTDQEQVIEAVYAKPKELPKTSEQAKQRNTAIIALLSLVGLGGLATYLGLRKRDEK
jgi:uncharacterized protein YabE (DUF348 family)